MDNFIIVSLSLFLLGVKIRPPVLKKLLTGVEDGSDLIYFIKKITDRKLLFLLRIRDLAEYQLYSIYHYLHDEQKNTNGKKIKIKKKMYS